MTFRAIVAVCVLGASVGCDDLDPEVGPPTGVACSDEDSDPGHAVAFHAEILQLFRSPTIGCTRCHDPVAENPVGFMNSGLDLSSYAGLVAGGVNSADDIVVPGQPCASAIIAKLGDGPPFGARMPLTGPPYWEPFDVARLADWIVEGAEDN